MNKDPAFLFYSSDFISSTLAMSFEDRGKYITLLSYMHLNGRAEESKVRKLVENMSADLIQKFKTDENGLWYNERLEQEIQKRKRFAASCRENGKLGGRPPGKKDEKKNRQEEILTNMQEESFIRFWKMYDKPTEKQSCKLKWSKLTDSDRELIFQKLPAYINATPERQFRKNPLTYLNRRIWLDELIPELPATHKKSAFELLMETGKYE